MSILMLQTTVEEVIQMLNNAPGAVPVQQQLSRIAVAYPGIPACGGQYMFNITEEDASSLDNVWVGVKSQLKGGAQSLLQVWK